MASKISWIAAVKHSTFIWEFVESVLRDKLAHFDPVLRPSDYETFVANQILRCPELEGFSKDQLAEVLAVKPEEWKTELDGQAKFFETLKPDMPERLQAEREKIAKRFGS